MKKLEVIELAKKIYVAAITKEGIHLEFTESTNQANAAFQAAEQFYVEVNNYLRGEGYWAD